MLTCNMCLKSEQASESLEQGCLCTVTDSSPRVCGRAAAEGNPRVIRIPLSKHEMDVISLIRSKNN
jgi:hypothetical protein